VVSSLQGGTTLAHRWDLVGAHMCYDTMPYLCAWDVKAGTDTIMLIVINVISISGQEEG
jgi:hypothetical protein